MPVGFNSPARNLFLLGSSGAQVVTNFFKRIDQSSGTDGVYRPREIKYNEVDQKFVLAGQAYDSNFKNFGWFEKRDDAGTADFENRIESTQSGVDTTLQAMELDANDNLIVVGKTGTVPWIAKYSNGGVIDWQSTTNSADVEYTGVTSDSNGQYYACGNTPDSGEAQAFVEKFDASGNPGWGKSAFMLGRDVILKRIDANSQGYVVAVGSLEDDSATKGYIVKLNALTGEVVWDKTLVPGEGLADALTPFTIVEDVYIDSNDQIYVVGQTAISPDIRGFIIKLTAEGNIIWQKKTSVNMPFYRVKSDGETEQTVVFGIYDNGFDVGGVLSKYSKDGRLVWRRTIYSSYNNANIFEQVNLDADPSFYYLMFVDESIDGLVGTPISYTFGKVSSSGNGLGGFEYADGVGETLYYDILNSPDELGRLSDGSVRNDTSDFISYPFNGTKILFDDLATQVSNKKRQMDSADSFEYSGSPAIRPADFQELNLLGDNVSGRIWNDTSGKGNNGVTSLTEPFLFAGGVNFDGNASYLYLNSPSQLALGTGDFTIECWFRATAWDTTGGYNSNQIFDFREISGAVQLNVPALYITQTSGNDGNIHYFVDNGNRLTGNVSLNNWYHVALSRVSGTTTMYLNGSSVGTWTDNTNYTVISNNRPIIGSNGAYADVTRMIGQISNFRIVKGTSVYTANFTPPTTPLFPVAGTELLTCQGDTIADASANNFTITVNGNAAPTDDGPTHNAAGYWEFDGTDNEIISGPKCNTLFEDGGSGTIEMWVRLNDVTTRQTLCSGYLSSGSTRDDRWDFEVQNSLLRGGSHDNSFFSGTTTLSTATWYHFVFTLDKSSGNGTLKTYVNTALDTTQNFTLDRDWATDVEFGIGNRYLQQADFPLNGDIGEVRVYPRALTAAQVFQNYNATKIKYINEAPDTAPKIGSGIVYDSNLLLNYDFGNRATYDRAENLANNSETFENWTANGSRATITPNQIVAPDGSLTADMIEDANSGSGNKNLYQYITITPAETYTASLYVKAGTSDWANWYFDDTGVSFQFSTETLSIDPDSGPLGGTSGAPPATAGFDNVGNGWYRLYLKDVYASSASRPFGIWTGANSQTYNPSYIGDPQYNFYIWGAQVEKGSTLGRYIKTSGTAITAPTTVKNLSGTSIDGTINGATFNPAGYFEFDGTNDDITTAYTSALDEPQSFTYEVWVNAADVAQSNNFPRIFDKGGTGVLAHITTNSPFTLAFNVNTGSGLRQISTNINGDQWYHIVMKYNGQVSSIYLNGTGVISNDFGSVVLANKPAVGITLGDTPVSGRELQGSIGEFRYYNRELTATEVSQNFNATRSKYGV